VLNLNNIELHNRRTIFFRVPIKTRYLLIVSPGIIVS